MTNDELIKLKRRVEHSIQNILSGFSENVNNTEWVISTVDVDIIDVSVMGNSKPDTIVDRVNISITKDVQRIEEGRYIPSRIVTETIELEWEEK
jgi:hypothetical protein